MADEDVYFADKYLLGRKLGAGSFGAVMLATDVDTGRYVTLKFERIVMNKAVQLPTEIKAMRSITANNPIGIPKPHWLYREKNFNVMVLDFLGPSLMDLINFCVDKCFSLKTTLMIADQMISRLETIHKEGFLHRDIKPENFLMGIGKDSHIVHVIDFGLAKRYRHK